MAESTGSIPFPRWQIAVALGATGVLGLGYWYLKQQNVQNRRNNLINNINSLSIDDVEQENVKESPLEKAQRFKTQGNSFFKKGRYDEAIEFYNKAIEACPEDNKVDLSTFYQNRAAAHEQQKKWDLVVEDCNKALELNVKYQKALYRRAKAYEIQKDWEKCLDDVTALCFFQEFQNQTVLQMADRVLKELGRMHAAEAMVNKKPQLASPQYIMTYCKSFPQDPVYNELTKTEYTSISEGPLKGFLKAKVAFATKNFEEIIPACTEEINSSESESKYIFESLSLRATFYLLSGGQKEAREDLDVIINSKDADVGIVVNALIKRASLNMQNADKSSSVADFEKAVELSPNVADIYHHRGQMYMLMDKANEARENFKKAVELNPDFALAVVQKCYADYRYALVTMDEPMLSSVLEEFQKVIEKFPNCCEAYILYGQTLVDRQKYVEADDLYRKASEVEPKQATVLVHRALLILQWTTDVEKAIEMIKNAIKLDNRCEFAYETLGTIEIQRGNMVLAVDLFNQAIEVARGEAELIHLFALRDAAMSQLRIATRLGFEANILKMGA